MCYDYELEYLVRRAEEARKELKKPQPVKPEEAAEEKPEEKPVPA
jgi:hypothetical protein